MKKILFCLLAGVSFISQSCINDNEDPVAVLPSEGVSVESHVGGPTQPNEVWVDLSDIDAQGQPKQTLTTRTDWDLAFYSGSNFKVMLNSSIMMAAAKVPNALNIDAVKESDVSTLMTQVQVANFNPANTIYIDDVNGNYPSGYTAIEEVKSNDADNGVYLINMGKDLYTGNVAAGSVATGGDSRGWMKVQIVRQADGYKIKYAPLASTSHKEAVITKNSAYNYTFFSLKNEKEVTIQPEKNKWDISFTVFTNTIAGAGSYVYADFVITNNLSSASAYEVKVTSGSTVDAFNKFKAGDVDNSKFTYNDQRVIGGNWREVGPSGYQVKGDVFYIIKDPQGAFYKLRFTRLTSSDGMRGYPMFQYKPL
ncbi:hypothetical protein M2347_002882 [Chryseobacterium sp. H1D6B]|uniref:HmuY family protein n=1 Tax=Chryseobacterium sp. H1D6B TaxID=2940588 RepID=UPI0015CDFB4F|nr:HmuY family protein [Chryseobacterium sp. H1D6B]MDH6253155.1 hypothetical protein [Chryseobacterium sp. H1D6B]